MVASLLSWGGQADGSAAARVTTVQGYGSGTVTVQGGLLRTSSTTTIYSGAGAMLALSFHANANVEISGTMTYSRASANLASLISLRAQDGALTQVGGCWDGYTASLGSAVDIYPVSAGSYGASLGTTSYSPSTSAVAFRFRIIGTRLQWKHWTATSDEPGWLIDVSDTSSTPRQSPYNAYAVLGIQTLDTTASTIDWDRVTIEDLTVGG